MVGTKQQQTTVPDYIDGAAQSSPNDTWAIVPRSPTGLDQGWDHLSYSRLARGVDHLAWWIETNVGAPQHQGQTIGYMGYVMHYHRYLSADIKTVQTIYDISLSWPLH
jgi:hypothetical protein